MWLYILTVETPHFTFTVVHPRPEVCVAQMRAAWAVHATQTGADPDYLTEFDLTPRPVRVGAVYRDNAIIVLPPLPPVAGAEA